MHSHVRVDSDGSQNKSPFHVTVTSQCATSTETSMKTDGVQRVESNAGFPADARNETPAAQAPAQATQRAASADKTKTESPGTGQAKPNTSSAATALAQYNTYAKYASTIVRQILFGDSRFNNSKLVANTMLAALQVKGGIVPP